MTTRLFQTTVFCPNCKCWHTAETDFSRWIRANKALDSGKGYCVVDQDMWVHRYKSHLGRDFQLLMCVETKVNGASLTAAQRDTLIAVNAVMRNRRQTPTKQLRFQAGGSVAEVKSFVAGKTVKIKLFGMHVLQFSGMGPSDSDAILWDGRVIDVETLTSLLAFDLDPDTLQPLDLRSHHSRAITPLFSDAAA